LDAKTRERITCALEGLGKKPPEGDIKILKGIDNHRLRVGDLRILYRNKGDIIVVDRIVSRGQAYRRK
jgi:mRNA interferase RelE/StbE